jgi:hypothetical protein
MSDSPGRLHWRRSSLCGTSACVEVAGDTEVIHVRDSDDPRGSRLAFDRVGWRAFVNNVKSGYFDEPPRSL